AFAAHGAEVLGLISDIEFPRGGERSPTAGVELARLVRASYPDVPLILPSSLPENEALAGALGASFPLKGSPLPLNHLRRVILQDFGFGDFVFRRPDGTEAARASDLRGLEVR